MELRGIILAGGTGSRLMPFKIGSYGRKISIAKAFNIATTVYLRYWKKFSYEK